MVALERMVDYVPVFKHRNPGKVIPDYSDGNGMRAELDKRAHQYFAAGNYNPSFKPRNNRERVDQFLYYIYGALSGTLEREVRKGGVRKVQAYHTWQKRGERVKHLIGSEDSEWGLLYYLKQGMEDGTISPIGAQVVRDALSDMVDISLKRNSYLKSAYGPGLKKMQFFKDTVNAVQQVDDLVELYRYSCKFNEGLHFGRVLEWGPVANLYERAQGVGVAARDKAHEVIGGVCALGKGFFTKVSSLRSWAERQKERLNRKRYGDYATLDDFPQATEENRKIQPEPKVLPWIAVPGARKKRLDIAPLPEFAFNTAEPTDEITENQNTAIPKAARYA